MLQSQPPISSAAAWDSRSLMVLSFRCPSALPCFVLDTWASANFPLVFTSQASHYTYQHGPEQAPGSSGAIPPSWNTSSSLPRHVLHGLVQGPESSGASAAAWPTSQPTAECHLHSWLAVPSSTLAAVVSRSGETPGSSSMGN